MACLANKIAFGASLAGIGISAVVAVEGSPTVVISAGALAAMAVAFAAMFASGIALAECLENANRHQDAATLRRELDEIKRQLQTVRP